MPERRNYKGRRIKYARKIMTIDGPRIKITFKSAIKGTRGDQITVTPEEYEACVERFFEEPVSAQLANK